MQSDTFLLAGVQGGFLIAGAIVGFIYDHIGLGGVLTLDVSTYVVSFLCYFAVRKGRHIVLRPQELRADIVAAESQFEIFWRENARRLGLSAGPSTGCSTRHQLGIVSRRNGHRCGRDSLAQ